MKSAADTPSPARRFLASLLALCVFAIAALTVSPELHAKLHGHAEHGGESDRGDEGAQPDEHDHDQAAAHTCAVTLFAGGVETPPAMITVPSRSERVIDTRGVPPAETYREVAAHRLPPTCGPPRAS